MPLEPSWLWDRVPSGVGHHRNATFIGETEHYLPLREATQLSGGGGAVRAENGRRETSRCLVVLGGVC